MKEDKIKYLEFLQTNIARMSQCSFQIKGLTVSVVSAFLAVYAATIEHGKGNTAFIVIPIFPTVIIWFLDTYYLLQERKFRGIYNDVTCMGIKKKQIHKFEMPLNLYNGGKYNYFRTLFSYTEWPLYLGMIAGLVVGFLFLK